MIESFIDNINSSNLPPEKVIEYLNQIHQITKEESIPLDQVSDFVKQKIEEKKKIDEKLREADTLLQNKNMSIQVINEHIQLNAYFYRGFTSTQRNKRL